MTDKMKPGQLLYVRYYERIDSEREMITKKYYDLENLDYVDVVEPLDWDEKLGDIWPVGVLLADLESAAVKK